MIKSKTALSEPEPVLEKITECRLKVKGKISFETVLELKKQGEEFLRLGCGQCVIDLSGVIQGGSAAVSLLLSWLRYSNEHNIQLSYCDLPVDMLNVAQLSGVDQLLPILID